MNNTTSLFIRYRRWALWALLALAAIALGIWAFRPRPLVVEVAAVTQGRFEQAIEEDGQLRLKHRYLIAAPTLAELAFPTMELYAMPAATQTLLDDSAVNIDEWIAAEVDIAFAEQEGRPGWKRSGPRSWPAKTSSPPRRWTRRCWPNARRGRRWTRDAPSSAPPTSRWPRRAPRWRAPNPGRAPKACGR